MKIFTAIPVRDIPDTPGDTLYIPNDGPMCDMGAKLNAAIDAAREAGADWLCFHHTDLTIETPELVEQQLSLAYNNGARVCGVIGSLICNDTRWWMNSRPINTWGGIMQGYKDGSVNPMIDQAGFNPNMCIVDGCVLWIHRDMFKERVLTGMGMHLYDDDICFRALASGYKVACVDVRCRHMSEGGYSPEEYERSRKIFMDYWKGRVDFAVLPGHSKFKQERDDESGN